MNVPNWVWIALGILLIIVILMLVGHPLTVN